MRSYDIGITATRDGLTPSQVTVLRSLLAAFRDLHPVARLHHGDCVGGDYTAHLLARELGIAVVTHPPDVDVLRAFTVGDETRPTLPYLKRNQRIVDESSVLVGLPSQEREEVRSGTWVTIRYARYSHVPNIVVFPSGRTERHDYDPETKLFC